MFKSTELGEQKRVGLKAHDSWTVAANSREGVRTTSISLLFVRKISRSESEVLLFLRGSSYLGSQETARCKSQRQNIQSSFFLQRRAVSGFPVSRETVTFRNAEVC